jgi:DNA-binding NtrC family response regulator
VRLIAATNRSPERAVEEGKLREDLFYRLKVFPIHVPPLRDRDNDLELLAAFFLSQLNDESGESKRFDSAALDRLRAHNWPGNVREVRNVVERAFILSGDKMTADAVQIEHTGTSQPTGNGLAVQVGMSIDQVEKRLILATLEDMDGNKVQAAETLGISLKTLYNRLNGYGLGRVKVKA